MDKTKRLVQYGPGKPAEMECRDFNVIVHPGTWEPKFLDDDIVEIGSPETINFAKSMPNELVTEEVKKYFHIVFPKDDPNYTRSFERLWDKETRNTEGNGFLHVLGLIASLLWIFRSGKTPHIKYPESHLHPRAVVNLVDMLRLMQVNLEEERNEKSVLDRI